MEAEVAFVVADSYQGRGFGAVLFRELADRARAVGVTRLLADTLPENHRMLHVFGHSGLRTKSRFGGGVVHVEIELDMPMAAR